jgi:hypothetical protein
LLVPWWMAVGSDAALSACRQAGSRPGGRVTFFASPKKVTKKRRPRMRRPLRGSLAVLGLGVHRKTRCAALRSNSCDESVVEARCACHPQPCAPQRLIRGPEYSPASPSASGAAGSRSEPQATSRRCRRRAEWYWFSNPRMRRRGAQGLGRRAQRAQHLTHCGCLSGALAQRVPQCSPKPEHHRGPAQRAPNPGSPLVCANLASPSRAHPRFANFGYFLWRRKESDSAAGPRPGLVADGQSVIGRP